jgi:hypothetical protein
MPPALSAAGLSDELFIEYMKAIGVTHTDIPLSYFLIRENIDSLVVKPLTTGFKVATGVLEADVDAPSTRLFTAALRSIWYDVTRKQMVEEAEMRK